MPILQLQKLVFREDMQISRYHISIMPEKESEHKTI